MGLELHRVTPAFDGEPPGKTHFLDPDPTRAPGYLVYDPKSKRSRWAGFPYTLCGYRVKPWWSPTEEVVKRTGHEPELCRVCRTIAEGKGWLAEKGVRMRVRMRVRVLKIIRAGNTYRNIEVRTVFIKDRETADAIKVGDAYDLVLVAPSSGVGEQMSDDEMKLSQATLEMLLEEIKRRVRGSV
jgi:hypothetical protein